MEAKLATPLLTTTTTMTAAAATIPTKRPMKLDHFPLSVQRVLGKQQRREFVWDRDPEAKAEADSRGGAFERRSSTEALPLPYQRYILIEIDETWSRNLETRTGVR